MMERSMALDPNKIFNPEVMRVNLLLSSLYLSAYEILKSTIIEGVKAVIVYLPEPNEEEILALRDGMSESQFQVIYEANVMAYKKLVKEYEKATGLPIERRHQMGLIPSCEWLKKEGVLSDLDIADIEIVRDHRNRIAHELPTLLIYRGFDIDLSVLEKITHILKKTEPFFARVSADIPADIPDESIKSGGQIILGMIWNAVTTYVQEFTKDK